MKFPDIAIAGPLGSGKTTLSMQLEGRYGYTRLSFAAPLKELAALVLGRPLRKGEDRKLLQDLGAMGRDPMFDLIARASKESSHHVRLALRTIAIKNLMDFFAPFPAVDPKNMGAVAAEVDAWWDRFKAVERWFYGPTPHFEGFGSPDYWIELLRAQVRSRTTEQGPIVIDDLRFVNEGEALRKLGFVVAKVETPNGIRVNRLTERDGHFDAAWLEDASETQHEGIQFDVIVGGTGDPVSNADVLLRAASHVNVA